MRCSQEHLAGWRIISMFVVLLLAGCPGPKLFEKHEVRTQSRAGTVNVSVTLAAPWEEYVTTLQPKFELTPEKALEKVIPKTTSLEEKLIDALGLKAKIGLPQTSGLPQASATPGQLPADTTIPQQSERKPSDLPGLQTADKSIAREPMLEYSAAAALYQEIQILNSYVKDAALKYKYQPYVVRLQVGVLPYARNQPYDVYITFAFFPYYEDGKGDIKKSEKAFVVPLLVTDNLEGMLKARSTDTLRQLAFALSYMIQGVGGEIGLNKLREDLRSVIGTDINSLMTVSRVTDSSIQVRLGAYLQPTAGNAMIPRNHFITFLLMVPKVFVENKGDDPHVMVVAKSVMRHTENGEVLVVRVSKDEQMKEIKEVLERYDPHCKPTDNDTGRLFRAVYRNDYPGFYNTLKEIGSRKILLALQEKSRGSNRTTLEEALKDCDPRFEVKKEAVDDLYNRLENKDYAGFGKGLEDWGIRPILSVFAREIWLHCIETSQKDDFTAQSFDLPRPIKLNLPDRSQPVLLLDDGKESLTGRLLGGSGMRSDGLSARLNLKLNDGRTLPLMAKSVSIGSEGRDLVLVFPSLMNWKISDMKLKGSCLEESEIEVFGDVNDRWGQPLQERKEIYKLILYLTKDKPAQPPNFTMRTPIDSVIADEKASGRLKLILESKKERDKALVDTVEITLSNAQVETVEPSDKAKVELGKIIVKGDTTLDLKLFNLVDGNKITIAAAGKKEGKPSGGPHADIVLTIRKGSK